MPSSTASPDGRLVAWPFRRFPTLVEATARVDYPALSGTFDAATLAITTAWAGIRAKHVASLVEQAARLIPDAASTSTGWLDRLHLDPIDAAPITTAITEAVAAGQAGALAEARAQGVLRMPVPGDPVVVAAAAGAHDRAVALERILAGGLLQSVKREAVRIAAARMNAAAAVQRILGDAPTRSERAILKSGSTGGVNEGRLSVIRTITIGTASIKAAPGDPTPDAVPVSEQIGYLYATELLDDNTCDPCAAIDGTQYDTIDEAENDYPGLGGGYVWCDGREQCRGSLVVVYADVAPPTVDDGSSQAQAIADRVARDQIQQDAIAQRAQADARAAFAGIPPSDSPLSPFAETRNVIKDALQAGQAVRDALVARAATDAAAAARLEGLDKYTSGPGEMMNAVMRGSRAQIDALGITPIGEQRLGVLNDGLRGLFTTPGEHAVLREDAVVYRGITETSEIRVTPGQIITDAGFGSTTGDSLVARDFAALGGVTDRSVVLRIVARAGEKYVIGVPREAELIFAPGRRYLVLRASSERVGVTDTVRSYDVILLREGETPADAIASLGIR